MGPGWSPGQVPGSVVPRLVDLINYSLRLLFADRESNYNLFFSWIKLIRSSTHCFLTILYHGLLQVYFAQFAVLKDHFSIWNIFSFVDLVMWLWSMPVPLYWTPAPNSISYQLIGWLAQLASNGLAINQCESELPLHPLQAPIHSGLRSKSVRAITGQSAGGQSDPPNHWYVDSISGVWIALPRSLPVQSIYVNGVIEAARFPGHCFGRRSPVHRMIDSNTPPPGQCVIDPWPGPISWRWKRTIDDWWALFNYDSTNWLVCSILHVHSTGHWVKIYWWWMNYALDGGWPREFHLMTLVVRSLTCPRQIGHFSSLSKLNVVTNDNEEW